MTKHHRSQNIDHKSRIRSDKLMIHDPWSRIHGFTVVETLVALAIFSASIVFLIVIAAGGISDTNYVKNRLAAAYLAQEGIELVRNIRDTNVLSSTAGTGWVDFGNELNACSSAEGCNIDPATLNPCACNGGDFDDEQTCRIPYSSLTGYYGYEPSGNNVCAKGTTKPSPYTRVITIEENTDTPNIDEDVVVVSTVHWMQGSVLKSVSYEAMLMNWQPHTSPFAEGGGGGGEELEGNNNESGNN